MTVKELINILSKYDENAEVQVRGGGDTYGYGFAELRVDNGKDTDIWNKYDIILEWNED